MSSLEQVLIKIENEISIQKEDRALYAKDFDRICNYIMKQMVENSAVFAKIYKGLSLFGSYSENLKINKPDEFDVHFKLQLPYQQQMMIKPQKKGFVSLDITNILSNIKKNNFDKELVNFLEELCYEGSKILSGAKLQDWFENEFQKIFENKEIRITGIDEFDYTLSYQKKLTAHTIGAVSNNSNRNMDIDLVPAFEFQGKEIAGFSRPIPNKINKIFFVVPKPKNFDRFSFSVCAPQAERDILLDKQNLKGSMRLLKSLRNKIGSNIKSYYIRTCYLNETDIVSDSFWNKAYGLILIHMIEVLVRCLKNGNIPCYWAPDFNILECLSPRQIKEAIEMLEENLRKLKIWSSQKVVSYEAVRSIFN